MENDYVSREEFEELKKKLNVFRKEVKKTVKEMNASNQRKFKKIVNLLETL